MNNPTPDYNDFTKRVKDELRVFQNFTAILEKADGDGYLPLVLDSLNKIFTSEVGFAVEGMLTRITKTQGKEENFKLKEASRDQYIYL